MQCTEKPFANKAPATKINGVRELLKLRNEVSLGNSPLLNSFYLVFPFTFPSDFNNTKNLFIHQQSISKIYINSLPTLLRYSAYELKLAEYSFRARS